MPKQISICAVLYEYFFMQLILKIARICFEIPLLTRIESSEHVIHACTELET